MKKRTKAYRPKPVSLIGGIGVFAARHDREELRKPLDDDQVTDLAVAYRLAFNQMLTGHANEENWSVVTCSLNIAMVLSENGIGAEYLDSFLEALEGAFRAKIRASRCGSWGFDGEAIQAIKYAFQIHEAQLEIASKIEIKEALYEVRLRADSGNVFREAA